MIKSRFLLAGQLLSALAIAALVGWSSAPASAQRYPDNSNHDKPRGRGDSGGGSNAGQLILRLAPAIIKGLSDHNRRNGRRDYDRRQDSRPEPRRRKRRPRVTKPRARPAPRQPRKVTVIPPIPPAPPNRLLPPPQPTSTPPSPLLRSSVFSERRSFKDNEVVVIVSAEDPDAVATQIAQDFNLELLETLNLALLETRSVYRFGIPDGRAVPVVVASLATVPNAVSGPNNYYYLNGNASAPALSLQYALPKMRVPDAQEIASGRGMSIAVIDSGVDTSHPSFEAANLTLIDVVEDGVKGPDKHGTAIAGIIAAGGDMVGIAPSARILAVRAFAPEQLGTPPVTTATTLARAVDEAFAQGARIFNMSFAGEQEPLLIEMIDAAYERGSIFVAAAGNEGPDAPPAYPAAHDKVIAITATDESDALFQSANRGGYVLAAAPGVDIFAPVTDQGFDYLSGTSFAAAHVTGVVALLMERNPSLSAEAVRAALVDAAHDLGPEGLDADFGAGLTDAYGALQMVDKKLVEKN